jgi:hypothetical protein
VISEGFAKLQLGTRLFRHNAALLSKGIEAASLAHRIALPRDAVPYPTRMDF